LATQKREHSRKPDEFYDIVESCSPGPYLELFARGPRKGWSVWGNQSDDYYPAWPTYSNHSQSERSKDGAGKVAVSLAPAPAGK
jgi:MT-A70 protein